MTSLPVRPRQLTAAGALATAVLLAGAGITAAAPTAPDDKVQVVHVAAASQQERSRVNALGLDTTEHGDRTGVEVVSSGALAEAVGVGPAQLRKDLLRVLPEQRWCSEDVALGAVERREVFLVGGVRCTDR